MRARCRYSGDPAEPEGPSVKSYDDGPCYDPKKCWMSSGAASTCLSFCDGRGAESRPGSLWTALSQQHQWRPCPAFPVRPSRPTTIPPLPARAKLTGREPSLALVQVLPVCCYWILGSFLNGAGPLGRSEPAPAAVQDAHRPRRRRHFRLSCSAVLGPVVLARKDACVDGTTPFAAKRGLL